MPSSMRSEEPSAAHPRRSLPDRQPDAILLVGDGGALATLRGAGYRAVAVGPEELGDRLASAWWGLLLVGWTREHVDALAVCRDIRAHPRGPDVPVVVQASVEHGDRPAAVLQAGADDYVLVPWEPVELLTRVRLALSAQRTSGAESHWLATIANLPGAVYRCEIDSDWTMHYISEQVLELTGYPPSELIGSAGRAFASVIHPDDRADVEAEVTAAVQRDESFVCEYRITRADGDVRWVVDRGRLVDGWHGRRWLDGFIADITARRRAEQRLHATLAEQATTEERARLARDLHDSVSQSLFSMTLHARAAQLALERSGSADGGPEHRSIAELRNLTQTALAEMRALIFELRPDALADEGLVSALHKHTTAIAAREAITVSVTAPSHIDLGAPVEEALYRVVQEALHNIVKHAEASTVTVTLERQDVEGLVTIEVRDDGVGFDPDSERPGHLGLLTMRERATRVGGTLQIASASGRGTCVRVRAPAFGTS